MTKYYAEITESLTWSVTLDVPENIIEEGETAIRDYVYEHWGCCEDKDIRHDGECEIVTLQKDEEQTCTQ